MHLVLNDQQIWFSFQVGKLKDVIQVDKLKDVIPECSYRGYGFEVW